MQNLAFKFNISRIYCVFLAAMLVGSGIIVVLLALPFWVKALMLAALIGYGAPIYWRFALLRGALSVLEIAKLDQKRWRVSLRDDEFDSELRGDSTITNLVCVLRFNMPGRRTPLVCIVFRDALSSDDYRRLVGVIRMG